MPDPMGGSPSPPRYRRKSSATQVLRPREMPEDHTRHLDSVVVQTPRESVVAAEPGQEIDPSSFLGRLDKRTEIADSEGRLSTRGRAKKMSKSAKLKRQFATSRGRHCCLRFMGNVKREISSNNLPINFITTTSVFSPRIVRLCLFTLGILLEVAVCAFFFDLSGTQDEESMTDNFWIGLYSATFVALPMLLAGWVLTFPGRYKKQIEMAIASRNLVETYNRFSKRFCCVKVAGYVIFSVLSAFLSLYILAFCHVASDEISWSWVKSSIIGVSIDQVVFELSPAMIVALFVLLASLGRGLHWVIYMAVLVELYRVYRNLTDS